MMSMVQVALPKAESDSTKDFRDKLLASFVENIPGFNPNEDASENFKSNQIVVVCANAGFPLRFLENMKVLKEKYDRLLAAPQSDLNRMVLHTESFKKPLPPLFEMEKGPLAESMKKPLMLAFALQILQPQSDPTTGEKFYAIRQKDEIFGDQWVKLAKDFAGCLDALSSDFKKCKTLEADVEKELKIQARSNDQKAEVRKALGAVVQQIILPTMCEGNQFNPVYEEYKKKAMEIISTELKDL